jgi:lambda repressor-like predicted transcriptional regulator
MAPLCYISEDIRKALIKMNGRPLRQQAEQLGLAPTTIRNYRSALIKVGLLPPMRRSAVPEDVERIRRLIQRGMSLAGVAERVGISTDTCWRIMRRHKIARTAEVWSGREIMALFGVHRRTLVHWRNEGWLALLQTRGDQFTSGAPQRATRDDLVRFLHVREAWPAYVPNLITDPALRALALQVRRVAGGEWVGLKELAARARLSIDATAKRLRKGWLGAWPQTLHGRERFVWWPAGAPLPEYVERPRYRPRPPRHAAAIRAAMAEAGLDYLATNRKQPRQRKEQRYAAD